MAGGRVIWRLTSRTLMLDVIGEEYKRSIHGIHCTIEEYHEVIVHLVPLRWLAWMTSRGEVA